jgi:hypothetical protein
MRSFRIAVRNAEACPFASRNASSSESGTGEGAGTWACDAAAQTRANNTARGIALDLADFNILNPQLGRVYPREP